MRIRRLPVDGRDRASGRMPRAWVGRKDPTMRQIPTRLFRLMLIARLPALALGVLALATVASGGVTSLRVGAPRARATAPVGLFTFGTENSWIRVQNIGAVAANVTVTYFDEGGAQAGQDGCPSPTCGAIGPGQGWTFFQQ